MVGRRKGWARGLEKITPWVGGAGRYANRKTLSNIKTLSDDNSKRKKKQWWEYKDNFLQLQKIKKILMTNLVTINLIFTKLSWVWHNENRKIMLCQSSKLGGPTCLKNQF